MPQNNPKLSQELTELRQKIKASKTAFDSTIAAYKALLDAFHTFRNSIGIVHQIKYLKDLPRALEDIARVRSLPILHLVLDKSFFAHRVPEEITLVPTEILDVHLAQFSPTIHAPRLYLGNIYDIDHPDFFLSSKIPAQQGSCFIFALRHKHQQQKTIGILSGADPDPSRFAPDQATDFLEHFCDTLSCTLVTLLEHAQLEEMSVSDSLTGVHNRAYLERHAQRILDFASRKNLPAHLLFIDLNGFKKVNDTLGHEAGDLVLIAVARTIQAMVRKYDIFVRLGGDEFVIILPDTNEHKAYSFVQRLNYALRRIDVADISGVPTNITISTSIGMARYRNGMTLEELIRAADQAMYTQKHLSRGYSSDQDQDLPDSDLKANVS